VLEYQTVYIHTLLAKKMASSSVKPDPQLTRLLGNSSVTTIEGIDDSYYQTVRAVDGYTGVDNTQPIVFDIQNTLNDAIDLSSSYIITQISVQMTNGAGATANVVEDSPVCLAQNAAAKMFSRCSIYLNDVQVADECLLNDNFLHWSSWLDQITDKSAPYGQNHAYRMLTPYVAGENAQAQANNAALPDPNDIAGAQAQIQALFNNEIEQEHSESSLRGFSLARISRGQAGNLGENDFLTRLSPSAAARQRQLIAGAQVPLIFVPPAAIWGKTGKFLPPGSKLRIELTKASNDSIMTYKKATGSNTTAYTAAVVNYVQSRLMLRRVRPDKQMLDLLRASWLAGAKFKIPMWLTRAARFSTPSTTNVFQRTGVLSGPAAEIVYVIISRNYAGNNAMYSPYATAPGTDIYTATNANPSVLTAAALPMPSVAELYVKVAGKMYPEEGYRFTDTASNSDLFEAYQAYLRSCGTSPLGGKEPVLSWYGFKKNYTIFPISLRPNGSFHFTGDLQSAETNAANTGGLEVYVRFAANPAVAVDVIVISKHTGYLALSGTGGVDRLGL